MRIRKLGILGDRYFDWLGRRMRPATVEGYRASFRRIVSALGVEGVSGLSAELVEGYVRQRLGSGTSAATLNAEVGVLRRVLSWGSERRLISGNALRGWRRLREVRRARRALTVEEAGRLVRHDHPDGRGGRAECGSCRMWLVLLRTGMRPSELAGLDWSDVDFVGKRIHVRGGKSRGADRWLPMAGSVAAALEDGRRGRGRVFELGGWPGRNLRARFYRCVRAAGIEGPVRLYSLRYTFATWLVAPPSGCRGAPPGVVRDLLGHSTLGLAFEVYAQVLSGDKVAAIERMDEVRLEV